MTAINQARNRTKLYGWLDPTPNFSTSPSSNAPEANEDRDHLQIRPKLRFERAWNQNACDQVYTTFN